MVGEPTVSLHRGDGRSMVLGDPGSGAVLRLQYGSQGLGVAPPEFEWSPVLAGHGSVPRGTRLGEREVFLPVMIQAPTMGEVNAVREDLIRFLSPLDPEPLTLRVDVEGRGWRELPVHYSGGLSGDYGEGYHGTWEKRGLEFRSPAALWSGEPVQLVQKVAPPRKPFLSKTVPFFPVVLADSTVAGTITVDVAGDAPAYPVWTVTPPGEDLLITLPAGRVYMDGLITERVVMDMAAGRVHSVSGANLNHRTSLDSQLVMSMPPGLQRVGFSMVGADVSSELTLTYSPQYLTGY